MQYVKGKNLPFGGISCLLSGNPKQLPPPEETSIWITLSMLTNFILLNTFVQVPLLLEILKNSTQIHHHFILPCFKFQPIQIHRVHGPVEKGRKDEIFGIIVLDLTDKCLTHTSLLNFTPMFILNFIPLPSSVGNELKVIHKSSQSLN